MAFSVFDVFSKRNQPASDVYQYELSDRVRSRILKNLSLALKQDYFTPYGTDFEALLDTTCDNIGAQYGEIDADLRDTKVHQALSHFMACSVPRALDFLELLFRAPKNYHQGQKCVEVINAILEDEGVGFELTPYEEFYHSEEVEVHSRMCVGTRIETTYPRIIRKDEKLLHKGTIQPCLRSLNNKRFQVASSELITGLEEFRKQQFAKAISSVGSAFESVLKTICDAKRWPYDPQKDTCSRLLDICQEKGLFEPFYNGVFLTTATLRNKLSSSHGRGPAPIVTPNKEMAEHMIYQTCAHINLVISMAKF